MIGSVKQGQPQQLAGLSFVVLLHVLLIYAFVHGLSLQHSHDQPAPFEVRLMRLAKIKPDEAPPVKVKLAKVPQTDQFVPTFTTKEGPPKTPRGTPIEQPPQPPLIAGHVGSTPSAPGTGVGGSNIDMGFGSTQSDCSNASTLASLIDYPTRAKRLGLAQGQVDVQFSVTADGAVAIDGVTASNRVFEAAAISAVKQLHCSSGRYHLPINFVLQQ